MDDEDEDDGDTDVMLAIAEYLELNGFESLADAAAKGFGDTSPLRKLR